MEKRIFEGSVAILAIRLSEILKFFKFFFFFLNFPQLKFVGVSFLLSEFYVDIIVLFFVGQRAVGLFPWRLFKSITILFFYSLSQSKFQIWNLS